MSLPPLPFVLGLAALISSGVCTHAQPAAHSPSISLRAFAFEDLPSLQVRIGSRFESLDAPVFAPGRALTVRPGPLQFFADADLENATPDTPARPIGHAKLEADIGRYVAAIAPSPPQEDGYRLRLLLLPDDANSFPEGRMRVANLLPVPLAIDAGGLREVIPPGEARIIKPSTDSRHRLRVRVAVQAGEDTWRLVHEGAALLQPGTRIAAYLVFSKTGMAHWLNDEQKAAGTKPSSGIFWLALPEEVPSAP